MEEKCFVGLGMKKSDWSKNGMHKSWPFEEV